MDFDFKSGSLDALEHKILLVLATKDGSVINGTSVIEETIKPFVATGEFGKGFGGTLYFNETKGLAPKRLLVFNVGKKPKKADLIRRATAKAWKGLRAKGFREVLISLDGFQEEGHARAAIEGLILGDYQYTDLKSEKENLPGKLERVLVHSTDDYKDRVIRWQAICQGTVRARDLSQMPANVLDPAKLAELVTDWAGPCGYKASILEEAECEEIGMRTMLAVGQGSAKDSKFIIMEYEPKNPSGKTIALVGKAVTFDSGGLSLKPGNAMAEMKGDMGGGAAVVGIMTVLRDAGCRHRVVGLVPSVENMPSSNAIRPSDVVTSLSGITVEINNTDAEGRLILADALTYAKRYNPDYVIDFATLTGACLAALGPKVCGVMGNHQPLVDAIIAAGDSVNELFWQLPLVDEYDDYLKSQTADVSNISSTRWGGAITAGLFLRRFAKDFQWAHCDIAAAIFEKGDDYNPAGGTGIGVRMAVDALEAL